MHFEAAAGYAEGLYCGLLCVDEFIKIVPELVGGDLIILAFAENMTRDDSSGGCFCLLVILQVSL